MTAAAGLARKPQAVAASRQGGHGHAAGLVRGLQGKPQGRSDMMVVRAAELHAAEVLDCATAEWTNRRCQASGAQLIGTF